MSAPAVELRTAAFEAIAQASAERSGGSLNIFAAKILRDRTGLGLAEVIPAIRWALEHPQAKHLPVDSIVALRSTVMIKRQMMGSESLSVAAGWQAIVAGREETDWLTDAEVDRHIQEDGATVPRVGGGA